MTSIMYFRSLNSPSFPLEITAEKNVQCNLNNSTLKEKKETPDLSPVSGSRYLLIITKQSFVCKVRSLNTRDPVKSLQVKAGQCQEASAVACSTGPTSQKKNFLKERFILMWQKQILTSVSNSYRLRTWQSYYYLCSAGPQARWWWWWPQPPLAAPGAPSTLSASNQIRSGYYQPWGSVWVKEGRNLDTPPSSGVNS